MQANGNRGPFVWIIDGADKIIQVNENWLSFARDNDAPDLTREQVLDQPLWQFIDGEETRQIYQIIFARLRTTFKRVEIPFRCDSPDRRRFMRMKLSPMPSDAIEFHSVLLRTEEQYPVNLLALKVPRSKGFLKICSWCKKIQLASGEWVEIEAAVTRLDLFARPALPHLSHALCPECHSLLKNLAFNEGLSPRNN